MKTRLGVPLAAAIQSILDQDEEEEVDEKYFTYYEL